MTEETPKKKRVNSKGKGNGFENTLAKKLSAALDPLKFLRTQGSGARVGGKNFATIGAMFGDDALKLFVGDVVPVNEKDAGVEFLWSIESKFYKTPDTFPHLVLGTANVYKWMKEAADDAVKIDRLPMLIFKWNQTPIYVAIPPSTRSIPEKRKLTLLDGPAPMEIYLLDDLLQDKDFWYRPVA